MSVYDLVDVPTTYWGQQAVQVNMLLACQLFAVEPESIIFLFRIWPQHFQSLDAESPHTSRLSRPEPCNARNVSRSNDEEMLTSRFKINISNDSELLSLQDRLDPAKLTVHLISHLESESQIYQLSMVIKEARLKIFTFLVPSSLTQMPTDRLQGLRLQNQPLLVVPSRNFKVTSRPMS